MNHPMKLAKANNTYIDRISELPDQIIHRIQSLLPAKDAARTCILSKTWKQLCSLYPVVRFDILSFKIKDASRYFGNRETLTFEQWFEIFLKVYINFVEDRLSSVILQNLPLRKLSLCFILLNYNDINGYSARLDHLVDMFMQASYVQDLSFSMDVHDKDEDQIIGDKDYNITGHANPSYNLKLPILTIKGLQILSLHGCELKDCYKNYTMKMYSSLRELYMSEVILWRDTWDSLAHCCPSLEIIELHSCSIYFHHLEFPRSLKKVSVRDSQDFILRDNTEFRYIILTGTNLESLKCSNDSRSICVMDADSCRNIRKLCVNDCSIKLLGQLNIYQDFSTIFPTLEEAHILANLFGPSYSGCLKVASHHNLRTLYLKNSGLKKACVTGCPNLTSLTFIGFYLEELQIDCPSLRRFTYQGSRLPNVLSFNASSDMPFTKWTIEPLFITNMLWFIELGDFVKKLSPWTIDLSLEIFQFTASVTLEECVSEIEAREGECDVNLNVDVHKYAKQNEACLLYHLLRSTYPSTLTVIDCGYEFIKNLYDKLSNVSKDDQPCNDKSFCCEHWWHHVDDFKVECARFGKSKDDLPVSKPRCQIRPASSFTFRWSPNVTANL